MNKNIRGLDENGEEFEMDYEEYEAMQEEIVEDELEEIHTKTLPEKTDVKDKK